MKCFLGKCCDALAVVVPANLTEYPAAGNYFYHQDYQGYPVYKKEVPPSNSTPTEPIMASLKSSTTNSSDIIPSLTSSNDSSELIFIDSFDSSTSSNTESPMPPITATEPQLSSSPSTTESNYFLSFNKIKKRWIVHRIGGLEFDSFINTVDHDYKKSIIVSKKLNSYKCPSSIGPFELATSDTEERGSGEVGVVSPIIDRSIEVSCITIKSTEKREDGEVGIQSKSDPWRIKVKSIL